MRLFYDTSVLFAAMLPSHQKHAAAKSVYQATFGHPTTERFISQHTILELYCNLTRYPTTPRISAADAQILIAKGLLTHTTAIGMTPVEYANLVDELSKQGITGATVYDALIARCAEIVKADIFYTFNTKHFLRVWPAGATKIIEP